MISEGRFDGFAGDEVLKCVRTQSEISRLR